MGKFFGISDLPATTMTSPFYQNILPEPAVRYMGKPNLAQEPDVVIIKNQPKRVNSAKYSVAGRFIKQFGKKPIIK